MMRVLESSDDDDDDDELPSVAKALSGVGGKRPGDGGAHQRQQRRRRQRHRVIEDDDSQEESSTDVAAAAADAPRQDEDSAQNQMQRVQGRRRRSVFEPALGDDSGTDDDLAAPPAPAPVAAATVTYPHPIPRPDIVAHDDEPANPSLVLAQALRVAHPLPPDIHNYICHRIMDDPVSHSPDRAVCGLLKVWDVADEDCRGPPKWCFDVWQGVNVVGRAVNSITMAGIPKSEIGKVVVEVDGVSSMHAVIEIAHDGSEHFIEDLNSTNGTYIGRHSHHRLRPFAMYELTNGRYITLGPAKCQYMRLYGGHGAGVDEDYESSQRILTNGSAKAIGGAGTGGHRERALSQEPLIDDVIPPTSSAPQHTPVEPTLVIGGIEPTQVVVEPTQVVATDDGIEPTQVVDARLAPAHFDDAMDVAIEPTLRDIPIEPTLQDVQEVAPTLVARVDPTQVIDDVQSRQDDVAANIEPTLRVVQDIAPTLVAQSEEGGAAEEEWGGATLMIESNAAGAVAGEDDDDKTEEPASDPIGPAHEAPAASPPISEQQRREFAVPRRKEQEEITAPEEPEDFAAEDYGGDTQPMEGYIPGEDEEDEQPIASTPVKDIPSRQPQPRPLITETAKKSVTFGTPKLNYVGRLEEEDNHTPNDGDGDDDAEKGPLLIRRPTPAAGPAVGTPLVASTEDEEEVAATPDAVTPASAVKVKKRLGARRATGLPSSLANFVSSSGSTGLGSPSPAVFTAVGKDAAPTPMMVDASKAEQSVPLRPSKETPIDAAEPEKVQLAPIAEQTEPEPTPPANETTTITATATGKGRAKRGGGNHTSVVEARLPSPVETQDQAPPPPPATKSRARVKRSAESTAVEEHEAKRQHLDADVPVEAKEAKTVDDDDDDGDFLLVPPLGKRGRGKAAADGGGAEVAPVVSRARRGRAATKVEEEKVGDADAENLEKPKPSARRRARGAVIEENVETPLAPTVAAEEPSPPAPERDEDAQFVGGPKPMARHRGRIGASDESAAAMRADEPVASVEAPPPQPPPPQPVLPDANQDQKPTEKPRVNVRLRGKAVTVEEPVEQQQQTLAPVETVVSRGGKASRGRGRGGRPPALRKHASTSSESLTELSGGESDDEGPKQQPTQQPQMGVPLPLTEPNDDLWDLGTALDRSDVVKKGKRKADEVDQEEDYKPAGRTTGRVRSSKKDVNGPTLTVTYEPPPKLTKRGSRMSRNTTPIHSSQEMMEGSDHTHRILFTGFSDSEVSKYTNMVKALNGTVVQTWSECTHLVAESFKRTAKLLAALSAGRFIVGVKWLDASKREKAFTDEERFYISADKAEDTYGFSLRESVMTARGGRRFLDGVSVYATSSVKPPRGDLEDIVTAAGGKVMNSLPATVDGTLVIGCADDAAEVRGMKAAGWTVCTSEVILTGALRQTLERTAFLLDVDGSGEASGGGGGGGAGTESTAASAVPTPAPKGRGRPRK